MLEQQSVLLHSRTILTEDLFKSSFSFFYQFKFLFARLDSPVPLLLPSKSYGNIVHQHSTGVSTVPIEWRT